MSSESRRITHIDDDGIYECTWCGWTGKGKDVNPLTDNNNLGECPECGEPTPVRV